MGWDGVAGSTNQRATLRNAQDCVRLESNIPIRSIIILSLNAAGKKKRKEKKRKMKGRSSLERWGENCKKKGVVV